MGHDERGRAAGITKTRIMRNASSLALDKFLKECELQVICHVVRRPLDVAFLHEHFQVGHGLVLELLQPLVKFHVILVSAGIIVLPSPGLAPVRFGELKSTYDFGIQSTVPVTSLAVEEHGQHTWLHSKLEHTLSMFVRGT